MMNPRMYQHPQQQSYLEMKQEPGQTTFYPMKQEPGTNSYMKQEPGTNPYMKQEPGTNSYINMVNNGMYPSPTSMPPTPPIEQRVPINGTMVLPNGSGGMPVQTLNNTQKGPMLCSGCNGKILDRYLLGAMDRYWHQACLKCNCCSRTLGDMGNSLFTKNGMILCREDYMR